MNRVNMHYCAIRNTCDALREVSDDLLDTDVDELPDEEHRAFAQLVKLCRDIADTYGEDEDE